MPSLTRRRVLFLTLAAGAVAAARPAAAIEPAKELKDAWPEIQAGQFDLVVQRMQLHVTEWPLDHDARWNLATLQFGAGMFAEAHANATRVAKLERRWWSNNKLKIEFKEAWYRVIQLRAGQATDTPQPASTNSLLSVLNGTLAIDAFVAGATDDYFAYLDQVEARLNKPKTSVINGIPLTTSVTVTRPERSAVTQTYHCLANFLLGEQVLGTGDLGKAKKLFEAAVATEDVDTLEFHVAKVELARLS